MKQISIFDLQKGKQPPKPPLTINVDADDTNADWVKKRSRKKELEIHDQIAAELDAKDAKQKATKAIKATIEARAAALNATIDKDTKKE